jgi:hypothetical protein
MNLGSCVDHTVALPYQHLNFDNYCHFKIAAGKITVIYEYVSCNLFYFYVYRYLFLTSYYIVCTRKAETFFGRKNDDDFKYRIIINFLKLLTPMICTFCKGLHLVLQGSCIWIRHYKRGLDLDLTFWTTPDLFLVPTLNLLLLHSNDF